MRTQGDKRISEKAAAARPSMGEGRREADTGEATAEGQSQLARNSHTKEMERMKGPFWEREERLHVGDRNLGKSEHSHLCQVHGAVGRNLWFMV